MLLFFVSKRAELEQSIKAQWTWPGEDKIEKKKAIEDSRFPLVLRGPESLRRVRREVRDCHLARQKKSYRPRQQTNHD